MDQFFAVPFPVASLATSILKITNIIDGTSGAGHATMPEWSYHTVQAKSSMFHNYTKKIMKKNANNVVSPKTCSAVALPNHFFVKEDSWYYFRVASF